MPKKTGAIQLNVAIASVFISSTPRTPHDISVIGYSLQRLTMPYEHEGRAHKDSLDMVFHHE